MTREELLRHARALYECSLTPENVKSAIEEKFPELRESDDERIRNSLLEFLDGIWHMGKNANFDKWGKADCADWISYLEKQKEQKPVHTAKEMWKEMRPEVYAQASNNRYNREQMYSDDSMKLFSLRDIDEIFEKIGNSTVGSRPAVWSEEDTFILEDAITAVDLLGNDAEYSKTHPNLAEAFRAAKCWLKSLPKRFTSQEWSKVDVEKLAKIRAAKAGVLTSEMPFYRQGVMDAFNYKGFCSSWKPSEEQMKALEASYSVLKTHDTWGEDEHFPILMSLINGLQKLL